MQTRRFNTEAAKLSDNVRILTISCDLPFAQTRWCGAAGVDAVETLSDHRDLSFGTAYGVAIKELRLLSRAVFVICANGVIAYEQIVKEVTHDVDFEAALGAVKACLEKFRQGVNCQASPPDLSFLPSETFRLIRQRPLLISQERPLF